MRTTYRIQTEHEGLDAPAGGQERVEKYGIKVPKTREEKKRELELEKKRLKMN